jgi:PAS domain S-box-containing protein
MNSMPSVDTTRRILFVDDDPIQLKLGCVHLRDAGFLVQTASGSEEALRVAKSARLDAILCDVVMGDIDGFGLCRRLRDELGAAAVPVILSSAHYGGEAAEQLASRAGASALVTRTPDLRAEIEALRVSFCKSLPSPPGSSDVAFYEDHLRTNANQLAQMAGKTRSAEDRYRALFENSTDAITVLTSEGVILEANQRWQHVLKMSPEQMIGRTVRDLAAPGHEAENADLFKKSVEAGAMRVDPVALQRSDGVTVYMEFSTTVIEVDNQPLVFSIGHDVTDRVLAARALKAAEEKYRTLVERLPDAVWTADETGNISYIGPCVEQICGYTAEEMSAEDIVTRCKTQVHPEDEAHVRSAFMALMRDGKLFDVEYRRRHKNGGWVWVRNRSFATYERDGVHYAEGLLSDVTEKRRLEESVLQSQKMEAIGQLVGGIAHDFNNILAVILGNSHFLIDALIGRDPRRADAEEIKLAAEKGAALTRQLLAFTRRQLLAPAVINLNTVVTGIEKMLRRLIGENIDCSIFESADLASVRADPGQIEQVIMNLVINSRDAMPTGGKLTIETSNVDLEESYSDGHTASMPPGRYVMLSITDNGCGMTEETKRHVFEPFFTTKAKGKGTGLGLSTCYGIVKQSGGYIWGYSEFGLGTAFKVYLPRVDAQPGDVRVQSSSVKLNGTETILLVEDDDGVRAAIERILRDRGYLLLVARDGNEAKALSDSHAGPIHLVLSDVIMPGHSGLEVVNYVSSAKERALKPKALFMSGYTDHAILDDVALQADVIFLQKPFAPDALAKKVREVLDA